MEMLRQGAEGKVISFISASGGVGKTTMATHLAYHIASLGKRVLLMDFDPGAGLTTLIFGKEASIELENSDKTIGDLLEAYVKRRNINPQDYIKEVSMGYRDDLKKVYIIPSGDTLSDAMNSIWYSGNFPNPVEEVKKFISQISPKIRLHNNGHYTVLREEVYHNCNRCFKLRNPSNNTLWRGPI